MILKLKPIKKLKTTQLLRPRLKTMKRPELLLRQPLLKKHRKKLISKKNSLPPMDSSTTKTEPSKTQLTAELLVVPIISLKPRIKLLVAKRTNITSMLSTTIKKVRRQKRSNLPKNSKRRSIMPRVLLGLKRMSQNLKTPSNNTSIKVIIKKELTTRKSIINTKRSMLNLHTLFIRSIKRLVRNNTSTTRKNIMLRSMRDTTSKKKQRKLTITRRNQSPFK